MLFRSALAQAPGPQGALAAFDFLDKGDAGIAIFSGLRTAVKAVKREEGALEMDPQQAADAGLKAAGISWATWKLFEGSLDERARALISTETGRALLTWYVAADIVLPFTDNLLSGSTNVITSLIDDQAATNAARLAVVAGPEVEHAAGMLTRLADTLKSYAGQAAAFAQPLSAYAQETLPGILATADKVTGVAATGIDALSAYRALGAALVAEVVLARALAEVRAEVEQERIAAEKARAEAEAEARRKAEAEAAERARVAAEAERARQEAERKKAEAEAKAKAEAESARLRSAQREDYSLGSAEPAESLRSAPVKVTRSAEIDAAKDAPPAKSGCMGCGALILVGLMFAASGAVYLV